MRSTAAGGLSLMQVLDWLRDRFLDRERTVEKLSTRTQGESPSVSNVTYGVVLRIEKALMGQRFTATFIPKGSNVCSERVKLLFRKGQT